MDAPDDMTNEKQLSLRLPVDLVDRADALLPVLARLPTYRAFRLERSTVLRLALIRGLEELEREHDDAEAATIEGVGIVANARRVGAQIGSKGRRADVTTKALAEEGARSAKARKP